MRSLDWGVPVPFNAQVASSIASVRSPRVISYYGEHRLGENTVLAKKRLTTADLTLILASATRGVPEILKSLELPGNSIDSPGVAAVQMAVSNGQLPHLTCVDFSDNADVDPVVKNALLKAMQVQGDKLGLKIALAANADFRIEPRPATPDL